MYSLTRIDGEQFVGEGEPDQQGPEQPNYEEGKCSTFLEAYCLPI